MAYTSMNQIQGDNSFDPENSEFIWEYKESQSGSTNGKSIIVPTGVSGVGITLNIGSGSTAKIQSTTSSRTDIIADNAIWTDSNVGVVSASYSTDAVIVPANTITTYFDIHSFEVEAFNANDVFELVLYAGPDGSEVEVARRRFARLSNAGASPSVLCQSEYSGTPFYLIPANSQIKAKLMSKNGSSNTATISMSYNQY